MTTTIPTHTKSLPRPRLHLFRITVTAVHHSAYDILANSSFEFTQHDGYHYRTDDYYNH